MTHTFEEIKRQAQMLGLESVATSAIYGREELLENYGNTSAEVKMIDGFNMVGINMILLSTVPSEFIPIVVESLVQLVISQDEVYEPNAVLNHVNGDLMHFGGFRLCAHHIETIKATFINIQNMINQPPHIQEVFSCGWCDAYTTLYIAYVVPYVNGQDFKNDYFEELSQKVRSFGDYV
jgi:hypothetical protein